MNINLPTKLLTLLFLVNSTTYASLQTGEDGRLVYSSGFIPWTTKQGADGRIINYPSNTDWLVREGSDGRVIVYPNNINWTAKEGSDGRIVPYPNSYEWSVKEGSDGRLVPYKNTDFDTKEGADGRIIAYPKWIGHEILDTRTLILIEVLKLHDDIDIFEMLKFMGYVEDATTQKRAVTNELTYQEGQINGIELAFDQLESNPLLYGYIKKSDHEKELEELISLQKRSTTNYTDGWFFIPSYGWVWTSNSAYPYFYVHNDNDWMYFQSGNEKPKFYSYKTKDWVTFE
jgi:hypothetical protein